MKYKFDNKEYTSLEEVLNIALPIFRTDANNLLKPMKCSSYYKDNGEVRIKFPAFGQPKLNGFRVMARWEKVMEGEGIFAQEVEKVVFRSKEGLRYTVLEHIENEFHKQMFFPDVNGKTFMDGLVFDGEIYIHNEILSEISSAVRKRNAKTSSLKFHIFDIAVQGVSQIDRAIQIGNLADYLHESGRRNIVVVDYHYIENNEQAQKFVNNWIEQGYEGGVFRDMKATYQFGSRPKTMVKLKRTQDKEFTIVDIIDSDGAPELGIFVCKQEEGLLFKVVPDDNHEIRKEYFLNKQNYIGKQVTIKFHERTKDNIPFHIKEVTLRDYES